MGVFEGASVTGINTMKIYNPLLSQDQVELLLDMIRATIDFIKSNIIINNTGSSTKSIWRVFASFCEIYNSVASLTRVYM